MKQPNCIGLLGAIFGHDFTLGSCGRCGYVVEHSPFRAIRFDKRSNCGKVTFRDAMLATYNPTRVEDARFVHWQNREWFALWLKLARHEN